MGDASTATQKRSTVSVGSPGAALAKHTEPGLHKRSSAVKHKNKHARMKRFLDRRGAFQDRLLRDAVFARAEEEEREVWRSLQGTPGSESIRSAIVASEIQGGICGVRRRRREKKRDAGGQGKCSTDNHRASFDVPLASLRTLKL